MATSSTTLPTIKVNSSNIIFISDIHFGVNSSSEEWQENIKDYFYNWFIPYVKAELEKTPDAVLFCLGDVYHDRKSIDIDVNNLVIDIFEDLSKLIPIICFYGNHDLSKKTNKGNSSLRSISNINNLTLIQVPTLVKFVQNRKTVSTVCAIPYLGDCNEENKVLISIDGKADYALMHTDISNMKFDNGMTIVGAVDAEKFTGKIISGHIHKRQETDKVTYVGSPYQLSRGEIGNDKGIYKLDLLTGDMNFTVNDYSPKFFKIPVQTLLSYSDYDRNRAMSNNYIDIVIDEAAISDYKMTDIYDLINNSKAKRAQIQVIKAKNTISEDILSDEEYTEMSLEMLINSAIDSLQDVDDDFKAIIKAKSSEYLRNAQAALDK